MKFYFIIFISLILSSNSFANDFIWFTNIPPESYKSKVSTFGMHKLPAIRGRKGKQSIIQWVKYGESPYNSEYADSTFMDKLEIHLFNPYGEREKYIIQNRNGYSAILFKAEIEGFYLLYGIKEDSCDNKVYTKIAKAERLSHKCMNGHGHVREMMHHKTKAEIADLELKRLKAKREDFHYFSHSGEVINYKSFFKSKAIREAKIKMYSGTDWMKTLKADSDTIFSVQLINDYFDEWKNFDKNYLFEYTVTARFKDSKNNIYTSTYTDFYRPSIIIYKSKLLAWGLFIAIAIIGTLIVVFKRNKSKKYFDYQ
jgi:hypothetical protein